MNSTMQSRKNLYVGKIGLAIGVLLFVSACFGCRNRSTPIQSEPTLEELIGVQSYDAPNSLLFDWIRLTPVAEPQLKVLNEEDLQRESQSGTFDSRRFLYDQDLVSKISKINDLCWLRIGSKTISNDDLKFLNESTQLKGISFQAGDLRMTELTLLSQQPDLRWLDVSYADLNPSQVLPHLPKLEVLFLCGDKTTDRMIPSPGQFPNLRVLFLDSSKISDKGISELVVANPNLQVLGLHNCKEISFRSISEIGKLKHLKMIDIGQSSLSLPPYEIPEELEAIIPECVIKTGG